MPHPDDGLIHAWLDGELDAAEAARVEALVASDADWGAAAAEARGLIAASARIVGALDRVPGHVIPNAVPARPASRRWAWRAAAVLALMAGSAVVLERESPVLPVPNMTQQPPQQLPRRQALEQPLLARGAKVAAAQKPDQGKGEVADTKPAEPIIAQPMRDKDVGAEGRAVNAPMAAMAQSSPAAAPSPQPLATEKFTRLQPSCFEQREPQDSAAHIIRLNAGALADSIRLETLVLHGDTLTAANGRFTAIRVRCPEL